MAKGGAYEREIAKLLSRWWTKNAREDVFWRTSQSGGRATVRSKKGKTTANSSGDLCLLDPVGKPFLDLFAVEIKRGYSRSTLHDLFDRPHHAATQVWERWILQAEESRRQAGSLSWLIVARRDKRRCLAVVPLEAKLLLGDAGASRFGYRPSSPRAEIEVVIKEETHYLVVCCLDDFLDDVRPNSVLKVLESLKHG